ncbi:site-specific DNA-methyltransferase [Gordonia sp. (in: high G+C Gram-positive bacteria)]|uniref:site-specific DNA-methyltransferase n=1 Tax=Gordonia sp. (in: high G+C Gram-positive bacteria) TaxID=84139 RepID=UPI00352958DC
MARSKKKSAPIEVVAYEYLDGRVNNPTADAAETFYDADGDTLPPVRYPRDPDLDPQLVWRGKDQLDAADLVVDAPPIYIQEKIDPRVLIENLRDTAEHPDDEPELTIFDDFDGDLDELEQVEFYQHSQQWANRMILGDSLQVMTSLSEREDLRGQVQMIYIDPPYGIKFNSNWQVSTRKRDVKDGKLDHAAREAEQIKAFRDTWQDGIHSYLTYLRDRLCAARELLTESGSCFVQIGDENVHVVRSLLDEVFGPENSVAMIAVQKTTGAGSPGKLQSLPAVTDYLLWYAFDKTMLKYRALWRDKQAGQSGGSLYTQLELENCERRPLTATEKATGRIPAGSRILGIDNLVSSSGVDKTRYPVCVDGRTFRPNPGVWKTSEQGMLNLLAAGRVHAGKGKHLGYVRYLDDFPAFPLNNVWTDTVGQNQFGGEKSYVVQTGNRVLERCMLMTTDPGDLVLDPTCGSGTTAFVAEQWGRRWITIDTSRVALALARQRLMTARFPYYLVADTPEGRAKEAEITGVPADPHAPTSGDIRQGFVYERVQHITLKSIANNPDIREGMTREEIDAAIKRHADFEYLYDRPYEDKKKVRVTGRFTVESLSPHRSVTFDQSDEPASRESISEVRGAEDPDNGNFERMILDNLAQAGIQNGRKDERLEFTVLNDYAGAYVQAIADTVEDEVGESMSVALALGPQYGTVDGAFIKQAAKEALANPDVDLLCVLAFAFDAKAAESATVDDVSVDASDEGFAEVAGERKLGRLPVLLVRMNADLLMGEDLKKTGAGNLFTVFGEPDIEIGEQDGRLVVDLRGVDVYDPTKGEVRSRDTGQIAMWMIDTDYDGESFFVRHCYFTGGGDPYKKLKTTLKADIDPEAWASLNKTVSRAFPRPKSGKIAVKVINDYGDEVTKVFEVR